jgi:hypothetical protein
MSLVSVRIFGNDSGGFPRLILFFPCPQNIPRGKIAEGGQTCHLGNSSLVRPLHRITILTANLLRARKKTRIEAVDSVLERSHKALTSLPNNT